MKIGILTYHRSHNYGALLQGIALREVLARAGHQVTFIDYWPAYHRHIYALFSFQWMMARKGFRAKISYLKNCIVYYKNRKIRKTNFDAFIKENVEPYTSSMDDEYDVIVHGSDQIWRKQPEMNTYNPVYFGKHQIKSKLKVSYAASMGIMPERESDKQKLKSLLASLNGISVRESDLLEMVDSLGFTEARQDIDPTLLLTSDDWVELYNLKKNKSEEKYALYYKIKNSFDIGSLQRFAEFNGLKLKIIYCKADGQDSDSEITTAGPRQFLELMYNADFVFTSSFHGLAFSLLFHKPFLASFTNNAGRAASLLSAMDLSDNLVPPKVDIPAQIGDINYDRVDSKLHLMRKSSMEYLESIF